MINKELTSEKLTDSQKKKIRMVASKLGKSFDWDKTTSKIKYWTSVYFKLMDLGEDTKIIHYCKECGKELA